MQNPDSVVILHLSDLHFGRKYKKVADDDAKELILASLLQEIASLPAEWKPNVICISGDIGNYGLAADYDLAEIWIRKLLGLLDLTSGDLFLCPGNHDIERSLALNPPKDPVAADALFVLPIKENDALHIPFSEFSRFCERMGIPKYQCGDGESYLVGIRRHRGLVFVSQNTSWFAKGAKPSDKGKLWLGLPLLRHMEVKGQLPLLDAQSKEVVIALMHHPFDWLHDADIHQRTLRKRTDHFLCHRINHLLTGHTHDTITNPGLLHDRCRHFPAGAAFDSAQHFNSFRVLRIESASIEQISYEYDPRSSSDTWRVKDEQQSYPLRFFPQNWSVLAEHPEYFQPLSSVPEVLNQITRSLPLEPLMTEDLAIAENAKDIESEIKRIATLIKNGQTQLAQSELERLEIRAEELSAGEVLRSRIVNNLGMCLLENGDFENAEIKFQNATELDDSNAILIANLAESQIYREKYTAAGATIERARTLARLDKHVLKVYSHYLVKTGNKELLVSLVEELAKQPEESNEWKLLFAQLNMDAGFVSTSKQILEKLSEAGTLVKEGKELLARVLIFDIYKKMRENPAPAISEDLAIQAQRAKTLLSEVFASLKEHESKRFKVSMLTTRATAEALLNEWDAALDDYDQILKDEPQNVQIIQSRLVALAGAKRFDEASKAVAHAAPMLQLFLAQELLQNNLLDNALAVLALIEDSAPEHMLQKLVLEISIRRKKSETSLVKNLVKKLETEYAENPKALAVLAEDAALNGEQEKSISLLSKALLNSQIGPSQNLIIWNLANQLLVIGRSSEAVETLEFHNYKDDPLLHRKYAEALYFAGKEDKALELIVDNLKEWIDDSTIVSTYVRILESIGDVYSAVKFAKQLVDVHPAQIGYKLALSRLLSITGQTQEALETLQTIDSNAALTKASLICPLAYQYRCLGLADEAIDLIYKARSAHFADPSVHQAFISLYLSLPAEHSARQRPEHVELNTVVTFKQDGALHSLLIKDGSADLQKSEIDSRSFMGAKLLGAKAGDEVVLREDALSRSFVLIESIAPIYGFAMSESLAKYSTWFPERSDMQRADVTDVAQITAIVNKQQNRFEMVRSFYESNQLPTGAAAQFLGITVPKLWLDSVFSPNLKIQSSLGDLADLKIQHEAVLKAQEIVLDINAVMTIALLNIQEPILKAFKRVRVAGTVLVEIDQCIQDEIIAAISQAPSPSLFATQAHDRMQLLERAKTFVLSLDIASSATVLTEASVAHADTYGSSATATFVIAREAGATIYSDDLAFRIVTFNEHRVPGFATQTLLVQLRALGLITAAEYSMHLAKLLGCGYWFVNIEAGDLYRIYQNDNHRLTENFKNIAKGLAQPCDLKRQIEIILMFMSALWLGGVPLAISDDFLAILLTEICTQHRFEDVENNFARAISDRFAKMPFFKSILVTSSHKLIDRVRASN